MNRNLVASFGAYAILTTVTLAQDAETIEMLQDISPINTACRGGLGDEIETWKACGARDYLGYLLFTKGYCFGQTDQAGFEMKWHKCGAKSNPWPKPEFALN